MARNYDDLAVRYEANSRIENKVERAVNNQLIDLEMKLAYQEDQLDGARENVRHAVDNNSDTESIAGWLRNMKNVESLIEIHKAQLQVVKSILAKV